MCVHVQAPSQTVISYIHYAMHTGDFVFHTKLLNILAAKINLTKNFLVIQLQEGDLSL